MNNNENPNTVQPTNTGVDIPTVNPNTVPTESAPTVLPTVEAPAAPAVETPAAPVAEAPAQNTPQVETLEDSSGDPRSVGIDNREFIHPEAFDKINAAASHKDDGAVVNEKLKKVEVEYKPPSKFKTFLVILFFIFLIAFVIFLPDISSYVELHFSNTGDEKIEKIVNGRMRCELSTNTTNLDKNHEFLFKFTENQLDSMEYTIITKGDPSLDAATLDDMNATCKQLEQETGAIQGVTVRCKYSEGKLVETQTFDLKDLNMSDVRAAFAEAGGTFAEYPYGQDMDVIERSMNASGYDCQRES